MPFKFPATNKPFTTDNPEETFEQNAEAFEEMSKEIDYYHLTKVIVGAVAIVSLSLFMIVSSVGLAVMLFF